MPRVSGPDAIAYFGLTGPEELLLLVIDREDLDAEIDDDGNVVSLEGGHLGDLLFERHEREVGHRPDDPHAMQQAAKERQEKEQAERAARGSKRRSMRTKLARAGLVPPKD